MLMHEFLMNTLCLKWDVETYRSPHRIMHPTVRQGPPVATAHVKLESASKMEPVFLLACFLPSALASARPASVR